MGTVESNIQIERYKAAQEYWSSWSIGDGPWSKYQSEMVDAIENQLAKHSNYYAIDGGKWPPKALLRIPRNDEVILITVGMGLRPQPAIELHYDDARPHRRIELAILLDASVTDEAIKDIAGYMSGQSGFPWNHGTFLGNGHTLPADSFARISKGAFPTALLHSVSSGGIRISLPAFRNDPIEVLWLTPISLRERSFAEANDSSQLSARLSQRGFTQRHSSQREEVI
jgi:hypothetical protein